MLVARPGTTLADVRVVNAHPVAYAQTHLWLDANLPDHGHIPATSNVAAARIACSTTTTLGGLPRSRPPGITEHHDLDVLAESIGDNPNAVTRFVLVGRATAVPPADRLRQDGRSSPSCPTTGRRACSKCSSSSRPAAST